MNALAIPEQKRASPDEASFGEVLEGLRNGDPQTAEYIWRRYAEALAQRAEAELFAVARRRHDPEDITQSVFRSFFHKCRGQGYESLTAEEADWRELWALLAAMVRYKCWRANRRCHDRKHNQAREISLADGADARLEDRSTVDVEAEWIEARSFIEHGPERWTPLQKSVMQLLLEGYSPPQIAALKTCSRRTVERIRQQLIKQLSQFIHRD